MNEPVVHASLDLPKSLHLRLKTLLLQQGKSLKEWGIEQAEAYTKSRK